MTDRTEYTNLTLFTPQMQSKIVDTWKFNKIHFWKHGTIRPHFNNVSICLKGRKIRNIVSGKEIAEFLST